ncbi:hypothetical protein BGZ95_005563, partial [Linnemannia exigua]
LLKAIQVCSPNLAWVTMAGYVTYSIVFDKPTGLLSVPIFLGLAKHATHFLATNLKANLIAGCIHTLSWIAQFIGHGVYEKRAPKLTESVVQATVLFFLGYKPQLKKDLDVLVKVDIASFRARKALANNQKPQ